MSSQLSVIIPVYMSEDTLPECLRSITNMDILEIIIIDSEDSSETKALAAKLNARYENIGINQISVKRNHGAKLASGEYLVFLDSDCILTNNWVDRMLTHFKDPQVVACGNQHYQVPADSFSLVKAWQLHLKAFTKPETYWLTTQALAVRKTTFDKIGGFNERLVTCEDVDLGYRLANYGKLINDPKMEYLHLDNPKNLTSFFVKEYWRGLNSFSLGIKNKNKLKEVIYLLIPLYCLLLSLTIISLPVVLLTTHPSNYSSWLIILLFIFAPILLMALITTIRTRQPRYFFHLALAYFLYIQARGFVFLSTKFSGEP